MVEPQSVSVRPPVLDETPAKRLYLDVVVSVERLHRLFLDVLKVELEKLGFIDINNVQALVLYHIGAEEVSVGELTNRGYYLGSNVTYNLKKLVETGYLEQQRSLHDKRSYRVKATEKGRQLTRELELLFDRQVDGFFSNPDIDLGLMEDVQNTQIQLEQFWNAELRGGSRG